MKGLTPYGEVRLRSSCDVIKHQCYQTSQTTWLHDWIFVLLDFFYSVHGAAEKKKSIVNSMIYEANQAAFCWSTRQICILTSNPLQNMHREVFCPHIKFSVAWTTIKSTGLCLQFCLQTTLVLPWIWISAETPTFIKYCKLCNEDNLCTFSNFYIHWWRFLFGLVSGAFFFLPHNAYNHQSAVVFL